MAHCRRSLQPAVMVTPLRGVVRLTTAVYMPKRVPLLLVVLRCVWHLPRLQPGCQLCCRLVGRHVTLGTRVDSGAQHNSVTSAALR